MFGLLTGWTGNPGFRIVDVTIMPVISILTVVGMRRPGPASGVVASRMFISFISQGARTFLCSGITLHCHSGRLARQSAPSIRQPKGICDLNCVNGERARNPPEILRCSAGGLKRGVSLWSVLWYVQLMKRKRDAKMDNTDEIINTTETNAAELLLNLH